MLQGWRRATRVSGAAAASLFVLSTAAAATRPTDAPAGGRPVGRLVAAPVRPWSQGPATTAPAPAPPPPAEAAPAAAAGETVMAPPPERFEAPPAPAVAPAAQVRPAQFDAPAVSGSGTGTWAVVIGVNDYPGTGSDLRSAVNDADDVDLALAGMGVPAGQRLVLRNGQASAAGIREAVEWLVARAGPDATAVFFYGGHVRKLGVTSEALVGADGGLVEDRELGGRLSRLPARKAWIAIAACYGGGFTELLAPGRILTGAAAAADLAYESSAFGRSFLVQYMVRRAMIEGRAPDSVQAAFAFAAAELAREHPGREPVQIDLSLAPLDLRPVPAVATPPPPPLAPPPPPTTAPCRRLLLLACQQPAG